jgi:hypothetical protein
MLNEVKTFFNHFIARHLKVNVAKCRSLRLLPVKDKSSLKTITRNHRQYDNQDSPSITYETLAFIWDPGPGVM